MYVCVMKMVMMNCTAAKLLKLT